MKKTGELQQTKQAKAQYKHPIIDLLLTDEPMTKDELCEKLHTSEREVRNIISECSMYYPVIATSNRAGYRRAKDITKLSIDELALEFEEVEHQANEIKSRIKCLKKKLKPLIAWLKVAEKQILEKGE